MNERMKVMIAYDGSAHADAAIDDLRRAGMPRRTSALVVSAVDQPALKPAVSQFDLFSLASRRAVAVLTRAERHRRKAIRATENLATGAADRLRRQFPEWNVGSEILQGNPADELLRKADDWKPDLIVAGSQGRSMIGRFFLGSVSQKIAQQSHCSVRIARVGFEKTSNEPLKIIAGALGLTDAERVVKAIGGRVWADETKVLLVAVDDGVSPGRISAAYPYAAHVFEQYAESLAALGMEVSVEVKRGDSQTVFLETAENLGVDSIFVTARHDAAGFAGLHDAAKALITRANCTVEIVR